LRQLERHSQVRRSRAGLQDTSDCRARFQPKPIQSEMKVVLNFSCYQGGVQRDETGTCQTTAESLVAVPEPTPKALQYYRSSNVLWAVDTLVGLLIPAAFLATAFSARLRNVAFRIGRRWLPSVVLYGILFVWISSLLTLPLAFYEGFVREHAYGLSSQSFQKWVSDWLKGVAISGIGLGLVLWIPYLLLRRSPKRWWLYTGLATLPLATFVLLISPVWIDPMFNDFGRMKDRALEQRILTLAARAGIIGSRVFEVNKSEDTQKVNAYVTGVGTTKRIVLWDTILQKLNPDQVAFVVGHEMGHFVLHHVLAAILMITLLMTTALYVVHRVAGLLIRRFSHRFGFTSLSDVASFPLLLLLAGVVSFVVSPAVFAFSRHQEHEADRFGLELTRDNHAAATAFVRLQEENLSIPRPGPLFVLFRGSHPSLGDRVDFANHYRPWECGRPLRYGRLLR
jgi:STE24 endopeptidase